MDYSTDLLNALVLITNYVLIPSISYGSQLALGAVGVTLVFGILRFANFAHGEMMAFGTMATIFITWWFQSMGISMGPLPTALLALPFAILLTALLAVAIDKSIFSFYRIRKSAPVTFVVASVGVMFMMNGLVRILIGTDEIIFQDGQKFLIKAGAFKKMTGLSEGLALKQTQVLTFFLAVIAVLALLWFLQRTRTGKAMRAFSDNEDLALLSGINPERVVLVTWIIAASLATLAGVLYGLDKSFMRINLEKRRAMHAWKHIGTPNCAEHAKHAPVIYGQMNEDTTRRHNSVNNQNEFNGFLAKFAQ